MTPKGHLDTRFSEATEPTDWQQVSDTLTAAELYWLTTVRKDGRPHVTPLVGVWMGDNLVFCTGPEEQKARNLEHGSAVAVTTGTNTWQDGLDVIVEGTAERVTVHSTLEILADAYRAKYGDDWDFEARDDGFGHDGHTAYVYRVAPDKVIAFAKSPHGQTTFQPQK